VSALDRLRDEFATGRRPLKALATTGQLGYGVLEPALRAGLERRPDFIGADMGSVDPGPNYLGSGQMATAEATTVRDLRLLLRGARALDVPLIIGSAGTAGARPHLEATLELVRRIAAEDGLTFKLASITADLAKAEVKRALAEGRLTPLGSNLPATAADIDASSHIVGQMGTDAFCRALEAGADVVVTGRACDTAIYAAVPRLLQFPEALSMHMAKIIECASLCCTPGGRDSMLATLDDDGFVLDSMNPARKATPMSVAAHSLYEQATPYTVVEPEGTLHIEEAVYEAVDDRRTRVSGAVWQPAERWTVKVEAAAPVGERVILLAGSVDPRFIAGIDEILPAVKQVVAEIVPPDPEAPYDLSFRVYGIDGVGRWPAPPANAPREIFILGECLAPTLAEAETVAKVAKQYLLHHGFPGRLSTAGNVAFPFTPPEVPFGTAYRFSLFHVMAVDDLSRLFPLTLEDV
jgi:putative intracellular protease/amidase